ncbi:MAG: T9SS type A sorting domain-containing protein [Bacteroidota bacterium]|nr:T9SS type A sorting domain-containing protein [Bacteroidota bacterium]
MKKIAIIVFLFALTFGVKSSFAHNEVVTKALKPVPRTPVTAPFLLPQKFIQMGSHNGTLAATETLSYYNIDPNDNTTFLYMQLPYYFSDGAGLYAYGERFTSLTMKSFTVDSFTVTLGATNFEDRPGNKILFTLRKKLVQSPPPPNIFPAFTYIDSAVLLPSDLPPSDNATTFTLPFLKKVKTKLSSTSPDFWIFAELPDTVGNNLSMLADATVDDPANHGTPRPDGDRSYDYFIRNDTTYVSFLGGTFQDLAGGVLYNQMAITAYISGTSLGVDGAQLEGNALAQNYPNPFNPSTAIRYSLQKEARVSIKLYNALGLEVATILDANEAMGEHEVNFNADNLPTGTYFYTMRTGSFSQTKRMVLSK